MLNDYKITEIEPQIRTSSTDWSNHALNLNELLIKNPEATFFLRFQGNSMQNIGIFEDDIIVVDRSKPIEYGNLVIVVFNGTFKIRYFTKQGEHSLLNSKTSYHPLLETEINDFNDLQIWGTVSSIIRKL